MTITLRNVRGIAAFVVACSLIACGGGGSSVDPQNADQVTEALEDKIGGDLETLLLIGNPPPASVAPSAPTAGLVINSVQARRGETVTADLRFLSPSTVDLARLFAKIPGARSYFEFVIPPNPGKAHVQAKDSFEISIPIILPDNIKAGPFCIEFSGQDAQDQVSNPVRYCIKVLADDATPAPSPTPGALEVDAGEDQIITRRGCGGFLRGNASSSGSANRFLWEQISGPAVTIFAPTAQETEYRAPEAEGTIVFMLSVTDDQGLTAADTISVAVVPPAPYFADAGPDRTALPGERVDLYGRGSGGNPDDFCFVAGGWEQIGGPEVELDRSDIVGLDSGFTVPSVPPGTEFTFAFHFVISHSEENPSDTVVITVE